MVVLFESVAQCRKLFNIHFVKHYFVCAVNYKSSSNLEDQYFKVKWLLPLLYVIVFHFK